jgi:hypothetical protein
MKNGANGNVKKRAEGEAIPLIYVLLLLEQQG